MFKRKIYDQLLTWKKEWSRTYALLVEGPRCVGKTTMVKEFALREYRSHILIDFSRAPQEIIDLWKDFSDLDYIFLILKNYYGVDLFENDSLIIFDEVQFCPRARQAIKKLVADGRYSYIETGSFVSINKNIKHILIPSEEMKIAMYPMDFSEFLGAIGKSSTVQLLEYYIDHPDKFDDEINRHIMRLFHLYILIGGMPQAVAAYLEYNDFSKVDQVKRSILDLYFNDFGELDNKGALNKVFRNIPASLESCKKKCSMETLLGKRIAYNSKVSMFSILNESRTVIPAFYSSDPTLPYPMGVCSDRYKLYMADTGLLITLMYYNQGYHANPIYRQVLAGIITSELGFIYRNAVAVMLDSSEVRLLYGTIRDDSGHRNYGVDFYYKDSDKLYLIDVNTSWSRYNASLDHISRRYSSSNPRIIILQNEKFLMDKDVLYLPIYFACMLEKVVADL